MVLRGMLATCATLGIAVAAFAGPPANCPNENGGDCLTATPEIGGCQDGTCCALVCATLPECCIDGAGFGWDQACADTAAIMCDIVQPCDGTQTHYSNVTTFAGGAFASQLGSVIYADDITPETGGLVTEISFGLANLNLTAPVGGPSSNMTNATLTILIIDGTNSGVAPVVPGDILIEIPVDLTGLFDGGDPLEPQTFTIITLTLDTPIIVPSDFFWVGFRPETATYTGSGAIENVSQVVFNPPDIGTSDNVFWVEGFGLAILDGGNTPANFAWEFVGECGPGACCFPATGTCDDDMEEADCETAGGLFQGSGTTCATVECPVLGACCLISGDCLPDMFQDECESDFGGTWQGPLSDCGAVECPLPCDLSAAAGAGSPEGEACGMALNEGCNSKTQTDFATIDCGETVNGLSWADGGSRDTDWYLIDVPDDGSGNGRLTVTLTSQFPADSFLLDVTDCAAIGFPDPDNNGTNSAGDCAEYSYSVCVPAGQYAIFVGAAIEDGPLFDGLPCDSGANSYTLTAVCGSCDEEPGDCQSDCVGSDFMPPGDGEVDGADLGILLGDWGPCPGCCSDSVASDFMPPGDGEVDGADLGILLGNWGTCN